MFSRKKKSATFENGNNITTAPVSHNNNNISTQPQQKSVSYDHPSSDKMSKSKMLSPPPPIPQQVASSTPAKGDNTAAKQVKTPPIS